jgi:hypothetical protein
MRGELLVKTKNKPTDKKPKHPLKIRTAPPDDPIYTRGFVIGMIGRNRLPKLKKGDE